MRSIEFLADLLTEDPDVLLEGSSRVVIAVHPNHVIDAVVQAASKHADDTSYRDMRAKMMVNYNQIFQEFMESRRNSTIIITRLSAGPYAIQHWYDPKHDEVSDPSKIEMEKVEALQAHQDLEDYLAELRNQNNVSFFPEVDAGDSCDDPRLIKLLQEADLIELVGGNLTGCLKRTLEKIEGLTDTEVRVVEQVSFDDDSKFWSRISGL